MAWHSLPLLALPLVFLLVFAVDSSALSRLAWYSLVGTFGLLGQLVAAIALLGGLALVVWALWPERAPQPRPRGAAAKPRPRRAAGAKATAGGGAARRRSSAAVPADASPQPDAPAIAEVPPTAAMPGLDEPAQAPAPTPAPRAAARRSPRPAGRAARARRDGEVPAQGDRVG